MKFKTYLVGGAVRDEILGVNPKDLDFVVMAPSFEAMREALIEDGAKLYTEKPQFITIRCHHPKFGAADFACARKEGSYTDGRHPDEVSIADNLEQDLARRDFTIGSMAKDIETGEIFDPFNGRADIRDRIIRCVGNPFDRFNEDKLRVFRALRFAIQKEFYIHDSITEAITSIIESSYDGVSTERINEELTKMFIVNSWRATYYLFQAHPQLARLMESRGIWLSPTTKEKQQTKPKNFVEVMG
jgi:tRNA nucleotidyltransferase (CCA-adding enzyme)